MTIKELDALRFNAIIRLIAARLTVDGSLLSLSLEDKGDLVRKCFDYVNEAAELCDLFNGLESDELQ